MEVVIDWERTVTRFVFIERRPAGSMIAFPGTEIASVCPVNSEFAPYIDWQLPKQ
jgi:hypothetical protein